MSNPAIAKANELLAHPSATPSAQGLARQRQLALDTHRIEMSAAKEEGREEGRAEGSLLGGSKARLPPPSGPHSMGTTRFEVSAGGLPEPQRRDLTSWKIVEAGVKNLEQNAREVISTIERVVTPWP